MCSLGSTILLGQGMANSNECWCDTELNLYGSAADWAKANRCVDHSAEMCKDPCTGDKSKMCGGFWFVDVFQIRYEISAET